MKKIVLMGLAAAMAMTISQTASAGAGHKNPLKSCNSCHHLNKKADQMKMGKAPGLKGIVNRQITIEGVQDQLGQTWSNEALSTFLKDPQGVKRMESDFCNGKITDDHSRETTIKFLKRL